MNAHDPRREDGGFGGSSLVGSDESGLRSALESREAVNGTREPPQPEGGATGEADLGTLATDAAPGGPRGGIPTLDDVTAGTSAQSAPREARGDADDLGN